MFFKKKNSNILEWNYNMVNRPSNFSVEDYYVKASKHLPDWFSKLPPSSLGGNSFTEILNVRTCPSFLEVFKNSFLFRAPCDIEIEYSKHGFRYLIHPESDSFLSIDTHTKAGEKSQMGPYWDKDMLNIKMMPRLIFKPKNRKLKAIFLPPTFWNPRHFLQPIPGVLELLPDYPMVMNLNFFVDTKGLKQSESRVEFIKCDEPLALIYFPDGLPKFEKTDIMWYAKKRFIGDWIYKLKDYEKREKTKKCPF